MRPSTTVSVFSYSQIWTLALVCKNLKIRFCVAKNARRVEESDEEKEEGEKKVRYEWWKMRGVSARKRCVRREGGARRWLGGGNSQWAGS